MVEVERGGVPAPAPALEPFAGRVTEILVVDLQDVAFVAGPSIVLPLEDLVELLDVVPAERKKEDDTRRVVKKETPLSIA